MKSIIKLLVIILVLLSFSCTGSTPAKKSSSKPVWLTDPGKVYNDEIYITAIGQGFSRSDAEQDAAGKLARIFRSEVKTSEITELRYEELTRGRKTTTEDYGKVTKNIELTAAEDLVNIQFGESYTDDMGRVYSIAYLNRMRTADIYDDMIQKNSENIIYYQKTSQEKEDPLDKYAYAGAAWTTAQKNEDLIRQMKIISPAFGDLVNLTYDVHEVQEQYLTAAKNITFNVKISEDQEDKIASMITRQLTEKGFRIDNDAAYLNLHGDVILEKTELQRTDNTIFYRWELHLTLQDSRGMTVLSLNPKGRSGSVSETEAKSRSYRDIEKKLENDLLRKLDQWLDQIVIKGN